MGSRSWLEVDCLAATVCDAGDLPATERAVDDSFTEHPADLGSGGIVGVRGIPFRLARQTVMQCKIRAQVDPGGRPEVSAFICAANFVNFATIFVFNGVKVLNTSPQRNKKLLIAQKRVKASGLNSVPSKVSWNANMGVVRKICYEISCCSVPLALRLTQAKVMGRRIAPNTEISSMLVLSLAAFSAKI